MRGIDWPRAYSRSHVFSRSRLLDRFDDRWPGAFKFQGGNSWLSKSRDHAPEGKILHESARLQQNTVNDGLSGAVRPEALG
jgi:hypothetical protein